MSSLLGSRTGHPALEIEGLGYRYAGADRPSLTDVSLRIEPGEFIVLAGGSGSGKTSLLRAACGLIPHFHGGELAGRAVVAGRDVRESGPGELADVVGYVAQDPETQIVSTTVAAELDLPLRFRGDHPAARARAVEEVALALNIPHLLPRTVTTLSGGELQRVALAVALVTRPPLILLDEPTSQLDPVSGDELIWLLRRLNEEWGVAVVLAEHRLERCLAAADRVIAMDGGRIGFDGPPAGFLEYAISTQPELATPSALMFAGAGLSPLPTGVRDARRILRAQGLEPDSEIVVGDTLAGAPGDAVALEAKRLWVELDPGEGPVDVLRGIDLLVRTGEKVALMGRNGAGKSTLMRAAAGLVELEVGKIEAPGGIALLTQNPGDFLVRERIGDELSGPSGEAALRAVDLDLPADRDPRDLSGGERQRLALAIALAGRIEGDALPGLVCLDEPTRGMDRGLKDHLTELADSLADQGAAVLISTHDVEFAVSFADRVILLGDGEVVADAPMPTVLSGGWYFASEVARVLDVPELVSVAQGIEWLEYVRSGGEPS
ncbi:MAG: ATP-binding cassette domain-containing protein [Solirubrobacterales bacterium]|nr:ATP-binding cassette domain-containing protein [Solirubrobacterales bacterium]